MSASLNPQEKTVREEQYPDCDESVEREDLVFVYPTEFIEKPNEVADKLQSAMSFLKGVTGRDPKQVFSSRVIIGYTDQSSQPNWSVIRGNRIHIPWKEKYLTAEDEPFDVLSHELVHPFYAISNLHEGRNQGWGEGFCDFMRGPVKNVLGLNGDDWMKKMVQNARTNKNDRGGNAAGQFVLRAKQEYGHTHESEERFITRFVEDRNAVADFVGFLFTDFSERPLSEEFIPTPKMRQNFPDI